MAKIKLIAGLGNPGQDYDNTRHNVGFLALDTIVKRFNASFKLVKKFSAEMTQIELIGEEVILIKPNTFMNLSGQAIGAITRYFKIKPEEILIIHDDMDLKPGRLKLKQGGGHGGHNGLKDIDVKLGSNVYYRLRIGIGHPRDLVAETFETNLKLFGLNVPQMTYKRMEVSNYVLKKPSIQDQKKIESSIEKIIDNLSLILDMNLEVVQRQLHTS